MIPLPILRRQYQWLGWLSGWRRVAPRSPLHSSAATIEFAGFLGSYFTLRALTPENRKPPLPQTATNPAMRCTPLRAPHTREHQILADLHQPRVVYFSDVHQVGAAPPSRSSAVTRDRCHARNPMIASKITRTAASDGGQSRRLCKWWSNPRINDRTIVRRESPRRLCCSP